jgi:uncharacterized protein YbaR (Trm112 family)
MRYVGDDTVTLTALQMAEKCASSGVEIYICPACKNSMRHENDELLCDTCRKNYPIQDGIPDFLLEELALSNDPELEENALHRSHGRHL